MKTAKPTFLGRKIEKEGIPFTLKDKIKKLMDLSFQNVIE